MFETMVTIVGRVITEITKRTVANGDRLCSFRMVARERRFNRDAQAWVDGDKLFLNVTCWRKLAENVGTSVFKGDDVIVYGRLYLNEYEINGQPRSSMELDARAVGPDLTRCSAILQRAPADTVGDELTAARALAA